MAIRTQKPQVAFVGIPVLEPIVPGIPGFRLNLRGRIDMVDVECSDVVKATHNALAAQFRDERNFALPVLGVLVDRCAVFIPIGFLTRRRAITNFAWFSALLTGVISRPTVRKIASLTAKFPRSFFQPVAMHRCLGSAMSAEDRNARAWPAGRSRFSCIPGWASIGVMTGARAILSIAFASERFAALGARMMNSFHAQTIAYTTSVRNNFDIACRRIEQAYRQRDLFVAPPKAAPAVTGSLFE